GHVRQRLFEGVTAGDQFGQQRAGNGVATFRLRREDERQLVNGSHRWTSAPGEMPPHASYGRSRAAGGCDRYPIALYRAILTQALQSATRPRTLIAHRRIKLAWGRCCSALATESWEPRRWRRGGADVLKPIAHSIAGDAVGRAGADAAGGARRRRHPAGT